MPPRRRHVLVALASFTAAAVAGWFTASPPAAAPPRSLARIPLQSESPAPVDRVADNSPAGALAAAERAFAEEFESPDEHFTGERLEELCLADTTDLVCEDAAARYARRWAMKSPRDMYNWFQRRGNFEFPANAQRSRFRNFTDILFTEWARRDSAAAMQAALTCSHRANRGPGVRAVIGTVQHEDPQRAVAILAEHMEFFRNGRDLPLSARDAGYRDTWEAITKLPAGNSRSTLLGRYFNDLWNSRREESARIWQEMPAELREELATGSFTGSVTLLSGTRIPQDIPELEGMDEMRRRHVETTGDTAAAAHFVASSSGRNWAQRDPAAAVAWAQQYLKGEARVRATATLFRPAAEQNFDAALQALNSLPPGVLRVRALGNLAAGAPADRAAEVAALLAALPQDDRRLADIVRSTAQSEEKLRDMLKATAQRLEEQ